jgi:alpha-mannosidase
MPEDPNEPTFYLIPHTHWEGAVFQTRDAYLDLGLPNILRALALLEAYPDYRFTLDQTCYVQPFLERYPEAVLAFERFVAEGRLAIVGGTHVMLDVNMPGGESFIRQVLYGKGFFRERLGVDVTVGWQLDTFGHHAQMPQLLKRAGFRSFWFFRGVPSWETPAEFLWEGLDGSRIPAFWLPHGYAISYGAPATLPEFSEFMRGRYETLAPFSPGPHRVGPGGADVCAPEEHLPRLVEAHNRAGGSLALRLATPQEYEAVAAPGEDAPVVRGELNPVFQGIYSSRIELKQLTRELERLLTTAEKLGVLLSHLGKPTCEDRVWEAWERMLFNQAHDLMSGVMTDAVHEDTLHSFDCSRRVVEEEVATRLDAYGEGVDTRGEGVAVIVLNSLGWARTDLVTVKVGFAEPGVRDVRVLDPAGETVAAQIIQPERSADGALVEAEVAFVGRDVPALGHCVYRVIPTQEAEAASAPGPEGVMETDRYRVTVDPSTGAIGSLVVKDGGWEALRGPANVVVQEADHGDLWEPYKPLDGGSRIAMAEPHPVPPRGAAVYSDEQAGEPGRTTRGPVLSEVTTSHPFGERGQVVTTIRVIEGLQRVEVRTRLLNKDEFVRYRTLFPSSIEGGVSVHEIPFGAIERPNGIEFPAQNWIDHSDGLRGLALLNRGLPGNAVHDGTLLLSLLRCTRIVAYGFGGGYGPGMSSDSGFELGRELTFDYALVPHSGDWREAALYREGLEYNNPLLTTKATPHSGALPPRWGWLEVTPGNVVVSALKPSRDGSAALRVYEAAGQPTTARIRLAAGVRRVEEVDLMEDAIGELSVADGVVEFRLGAFEVKSLRLTGAADAV